MKTGSKNGSLDQFNKFMYYGIKKLSDIGLKFELHVEYQLYLKVISAIVLISAFSRTFRFTTEAYGDYRSKYKERMLKYKDNITTDRTCR